MSSFGVAGPGDTMAGAVEAIRASRRFWLWQGTDVEQASRIFRLRFGREPGRYWMHEEDKSIPAGHIAFSLDATADLEAGP